MKLQYLSLVAACLLVAAAAPGQAQKQTDQDRIQGRWRVPEGEMVDGKLVTGTWVFSGTRVWTENMAGQRTSAGTFRLDPTRQPKEIDIVISEADRPEHVGSLVRGLYRLEKGELIVVASRPGGERPTEFRHDKAAGQRLLRFVRGQ